MANYNLQNSKFCINDLDLDYIKKHNEIVRSGRYNFEGCRFPLKTNLKIDFFRFMLHDYEDTSICDFLEFGFPLGYFGDVQRGSPDSYTFVRNHGGAKHFPVQIQEYLSKEKSYGAILGPFKENPFCCNIMLSPLNSVPKKDTNERRFILDLSFPKGHSINDSVSKDFYLGQKISLSYPNVDDLVNIIKLKGKGCLLFKRDLRRFYRQIGIDIGDASIVGYSFNGFVYFDKVLSMGLKSAAFIAQSDKCRKIHLSNFEHIN